MRAEYPEAIFLAEAFTRPGADDDAREDRLRPVVHVLHLEEHEGRARRVRRAGCARGRRSTGRTCGRTRPTSSTSTSRRAGAPPSRRGSCSPPPCRRATGSTPGYEACENVPVRAGQRGVPRLGEVRGEEAARSTGPLLPLIRRLNEIRRAHPALQRFESLTWLETHSDDLDRLREARGRRRRDHRRQPRSRARRGKGSASCRRGSGCPTRSPRSTCSRTATYRWRTGRNYVGLAPGGAHVIVVGRVGDRRREPAGERRASGRMSGLGEIDLYLAGEGRHERLYERLGAHCLDEGGVRFAVWAPNARAVSRRRRLELLERGRRPAAAARHRPGSGRASPRTPRRGSGTSSPSPGPTASPGSRPTRTPPTRRCRRRTRRSSTAAGSRGPTTTGSRAVAPPTRSPSRSRSTRCTPARGGRGSRGGSSPTQLVPYVAELGLHPRRADAGDAASLRAVVGLPGERLLRAAVDVRRPGRLPRPRRRVPRRRHRRAPRLGARALPAGRVGARPLRRHGALRARRSAPRGASRLGHADLQPLAARGAELPARERPLLGARVPRRRAPRRRRRLDALPRLLARAGRLGAERAGRPREPRGGRVPARAERGAARPRARRRGDRGGVDRLARRLAADLDGRARLHVQVEHGLDERHAVVRRARAGAPALPPRRADLLARLRLGRELRPAALPRRGRPRQAARCSRSCRATAGSSSRRCGRCTG